MHQQNQKNQSNHVFCIRFNLSSKMMGQHSKMKLTSVFSSFFQSYRLMATRFISLTFILENQRLRIASWPNKEKYYNYFKANKFNLPLLNKSLYSIIQNLDYENKSKWFKYLIHKGKNKICLYFQFREKNNYRIATYNNRVYALSLKIQIIYNHIITDIMNTYSQKALISFIKKAREENCYEKALAMASVQYQLKPYNVMKLQPEKILQIFRFIQKKFYQQPNNNEIDFWAENQLRIFVWVVVVYAFVEQKNIQEFTSFHYDNLGQIFITKMPITLEFQSLCLLRHRKSKKWTQQQTKLLEDSIKERSQKNKWNQIAKELFVNSNKKYFRTPKQCRQQWLNHLDPTKIKSQWTLIEDYQLIRSIIKNGRKWSKVAKQTGNHRTEHMVKNRYKSLINAQMKRLLDVDKQEILISKIRQRLQSHSSIKKYLVLQQQKLVKKQEPISLEIRSATPTNPPQQPKLIQTQQALFFLPTFTTFTTLPSQRIQGYKQMSNEMNKEEDSLSLECLSNDKIQKEKQKKQSPIWAYAQQQEVDQLDIRQFFHSPQQNAHSVVGVQFFKDFY